MHLARLAVLLLCLLPAASHATLFRTYLSITGNDANDCSRATPCRLLPAALTAVDDGGEVWILDSGNFNTGNVTITKSVTILAIPGAQGSFVVTNQNAINVSGAGARVTLRNVAFRDLNNAGPGGILFQQGAALVIEDCRFANITGGAIGGGPANSRLVIRNSVFRHNGGGRVIEVFSSDALIENVEIVENGGDGIFVGDGGKVTVRNSVISGNSTGVRVDVQGGGSTTALVEGSTIGANFGAGIISFAVNGSSVQVTAVRNTIMGNGAAGVTSDTFNGGTTTLVLDGNTISHNPTGAVIGGVGIIRSRQNNVFTYNTTDVSGGSLTPLTGL